MPQPQKSQAPPKGTHMVGLWLKQRQLALRHDIAPPHPASDEALVRVRLAGICATDLELVRGYYPYDGIPGHEFVGNIVEAPAAPERVGERVVGEINVACGHCRPCLRGQPTHCINRSVLGIRNRAGAFAEFLCLPLSNLLSVPDHIPDEQAVFAEPLAAALEIHQRAPIRPTDRILVVGAGRLGQLIARTVQLAGCRLQVAARHARQRELLEAECIEWVDDQSIARYRGDYDVVIEASGHAGGFDLARQAVRPGGTIIIKSTYQGRTTIDLSSLVVDEIQLLGSRCGPMPAALRLLETGLLDPTPLIDSCFPMQEALAAVKQAARPGVLKVLIEARTSTTD